MTSTEHKYAAAAAAGSFCFVTTEKEQQDIFNLTATPGVQRPLCLEEVTDGQSNQRRAETLHKSQETRRDEKPRANPVHEKKHQPRKYEDTTSSLLERNTLCGHRGMTLRFLTSLI